MSTPIPSSIFPALPLQRSTVKAISQQPLHFGMAVNNRVGAFTDLVLAIQGLGEDGKSTDAFESALKNFVEHNEIALDPRNVETVINQLVEKKNPILLIRVVDAICQKAPFNQFFQPYPGQSRVGEFWHALKSKLPLRFLRLIPGFSNRQKLFERLQQELLGAPDEKRIAILAALKDSNTKTDFSQLVENITAGWWQSPEQKIFAKLLKSLIASKPAEKTAEATPTPKSPSIEEPKPPVSPEQ